MLKKYLNNNAINIFLNVSLNTILVYSTILAMFLAMPPENVPLYYIDKLGRLYLENILCALVLTVSGFLFIKYISCNSK